MSLVDNYILVAGILGDEDDALPKEIIDLNTMISESQHGRGFLRVDQHSGGYKAFEADVFLFAGNYFSLAQMASCVSKIEWPDDDEIGLIYKGQEDESFTFYNLASLRKIAAEDH